jgi:hypothetical protein
MGEIKRKRIKQKTRNKKGKGLFLGWARSLVKNNEDQFPRAGIGERGRGKDGGGRILFLKKRMRKCSFRGRRIEARIEGATTLPERRMVAP